MINSIILYISLKNMNKTLLDLRPAITHYPVVVFL